MWKLCVFCPCVFVVLAGTLGKCRFYASKVPFFSNNQNKTSENLQENWACFLKNVRRFSENDGLFQNYLQQTAQFKL